MHSAATAVPLQQTVDMVLQNRSGNLELRAEVKRLRQQLVQQSNESEQRVKQLESELAALWLTSQEDQEMLLDQMTEYDKWATESELPGSPGVREEKDQERHLELKDAQMTIQKLEAHISEISSSAIAIRDQIGKDADNLQSQLLAKHLELKDAQMTIHKLEEHISELGHNATAISDQVEKDADN